MARLACQGLRYAQVRQTEARSEAVLKGLGRREESTKGQMDA